jgi:hypothetical protein
VNTYEEMPDLEMVQRPGSWPCWPFLPLKRSSESDPNSGVLCEGGGRFAWLKGANLYALNEDILVRREMIDLAGIKQLLDDGWEVD